MPGLRGTFDAAVSAHLAAASTVAAARAALGEEREPPPPPDVLSAESALAERLEAATTKLDGDPHLIRLGTAHLHRSSFGVYVPFLSRAHLAFSADATDPRVAALVRGILMRVLGVSPPGTVEVVTVDAGTIGASVAPMRPLINAGRVTAPATDDASFSAALTKAEAHVTASLAGERRSTMILAIFSAPTRVAGAAERVEALARSGLGAGLAIVACGFPGLPGATTVEVGEHMRVGNPPNAPFGMDGALAAEVHFDPPLPDDFVRAESARLAEAARSAAVMTFSEIRPDVLWSGDPTNGLSTVTGRDSDGPVTLSFDDATPHWLIGGRTGSGKTVLLLDILYGLGARYSPRDLALYLLDFKEGVSFAEFIPRAGDPTFIPHARAVGIESDREYGVAILRELDGEMTRRSIAMKTLGVARYSQLRAELPVPRIVCVIDEFHVLFADNDDLAKQAVSLLENIARKGRSYGIHLVLASQTAAGVEALYAKRDSIFGQFGQRIALPGATGVLDPRNSAASGLRLGEAIVNPDGGVAGRDRLVRFPDAHAAPEALNQLRRDLWDARGDATPPSIFRGYSNIHIEDDPAYAALAPTTVPSVLLGRNVDVGLAPSEVRLDPAPGRHIAILGPDRGGADLVHAAALSLRRQAPHARFVVAGLAEPTAVSMTVAALGSDAEVVDAAGLTAVLGDLADTTGPTYLLGFGMDAATLARADLEVLRAILRSGPERGVHLVGWWRGVRRFTDDIGSTGREDVATSVILNVPSHDLIGLFGQSLTSWRPRTNRALVVDRQSGVHQLIVPFSRKAAR